MKNHKFDKNIILFPNLQDRLAEKGLDALKRQNYTEALTFLEQANELKYKINLEIGIILCLFELGELEEAKEKCEEILEKGINHDFQLLHIYITILTTQGKYYEVQSFLEDILKKNQLPRDQTENLNKILELSKKMVKSELIQQNQEYPPQDYEDLNRHLNVSQNIKEQWQAIQHLRNLNLFKVLPLLEIFLKDAKKHPMLKSILLELLKDYGINSEVTVEKFGLTKEFNPALLQNIIDYPFTNNVLSLIDEVIGDKNPTLFEVIKEIWLRHLFVKYPFLPLQEHPSIWAAALHKIGCEMHGIETNENEFEQLYHVTINELEECYRNLLKIEEISFLQI